MSDQSCQTSPVTNMSLTCQSSPLSLQSYACQTTQTLYLTNVSACQTSPHPCCGSGYMPQSDNGTQVVVSKHPDGLDELSSGDKDLDSEHLAEAVNESYSYSCDSDESNNSHEYESAYIDTFCKCDEGASSGHSIEPCEIFASAERSVALVRETKSAADLKLLHVPRLLNIQMSDQMMGITSGFMYGLAGTSSLKTSPAQFDLSLLLRPRRVGGISLSLQSFSGSAASGRTLSDLAVYSNNRSEPRCVTPQITVEEQESKLSNTTQSSANPVDSSKSSVDTLVNETKESRLTITPSKAKSSSSIRWTVGDPEAEYAEKRLTLGTVERSAHLSIASTAHNSFQRSVVKHTTLPLFHTNMLHGFSPYHKSDNGKDKITWRSPHIKIKQFFERKISASTHHASIPSNEREFIAPPEDSVTCTSSAPESPRSPSSAADVSSDLTNILYSQADGKWSFNAPFFFSSHSFLTLMHLSMLWWFKWRFVMQWIPCHDISINLPQFDL